MTKTKTFGGPNKRGYGHTWERLQELPIKEWNEFVDAVEELFEKAPEDLLRRNYDDMHQPRLKRATKLTVKDCELHGERGDIMFNGKKEKGYPNGTFILERQGSYFGSYLKSDTRKDDAVGEYGEPNRYIQQFVATHRNGGKWKPYDEYVVKVLLLAEKHFGDGFTVIDSDGDWDRIKFLVEKGVTPNPENAKQVWALA